MSRDNVLRVNRSLADFIGVAAQRIDRRQHVRAAGHDGDVSRPHSCPFCRTRRGHRRICAPRAGATYLVSTSRVHGASSEGLQTIHVLKDITDRREAERRYRELFDNIQEGLFFSTPDGRFIEVNDALVRMLGYASREELLQVDIRTQVYLSPERSASTLPRDGEARRAAQPRGSSAPQRRIAVHVLINAFASAMRTGKSCSIAA